MKPLPWAQIMRFGLGHLRLPPAHFWAMSLPELAAALDLGADVPDRPDRNAFEALACRYPDIPTSEET